MRTPCETHGAVTRHAKHDDLVAKSPRGDKICVKNLRNQLRAHRPNRGKRLAREITSKLCFLSSKKATYRSRAAFSGRVARPQRHAT